MTPLAERIKNLRNDAGLTQEQLAEKAGISQPALVKIEAGKVKRTKFINEIAQALGVDVGSILFNGSDLTHNAVLSGEKKEVVISDVRPLLESSDLNTWLFNCSDFDYSKVRDWVYTCGQQCSARSFFIAVHGESMINQNGTPSFYEGMIVLSDPEAESKDRDFVIAFDAGRNAIIFSQLYYEFNEPHLKPLNNRYPLIRIDDKTKIIAKVIKAEISL